MEQKTIFPVFSAPETALDRASLQTRPEPGQILLCEPTFFDVIDTKNPFMDSHIGGIDKNLARSQWQALKITYENLDIPVHLIPPGNGLEDMVFTANQVLPFIDKDGRKSILLSKMRHASRQKEIPHFEQWFKQQGYTIYTLPVTATAADSQCFEGQGDAIWHPERKLLWGGFGARTDESVYNLISQLIEAPIAKLHLPHPNFYHLDTCFCALSPTAVMIYPDAFDQAGIALIKHYFPTVVEVSEAEAFNFVCNSVAIGSHVIMQKNSPQAKSQLEKLGFSCLEVDTSEFMKSGGSVFCLKMLIY